jgi:hypothetical protein
MIISVLQLGFVGLRHPDKLEKGFLREPWKLRGSNGSTTRSSSSAGGPGEAFVRIVSMRLLFYPLQRLIVFPRRRIEDGDQIELRADILNE